MAKRKKGDGIRQVEADNNPKLIPLEKKDIEKAPTPAKRDSKKRSGKKNK